MRQGPHAPTGPCINALPALRITSTLVCVACHSATLYDHGRSGSKHLQAYAEGGGGEKAMGWAEHTAAALLLPTQLSTGSQPQARQRPKSLSRPLHCTWDTQTGKPPSSVVLEAEAYGRPRDLGAGQET